MTDPAELQAKADLLDRLCPAVEALLDKLRDEAGERLLASLSRDHHILLEKAATIARESR